MFFVCSSARWPEKPVRSWLAAPPGLQGKSVAIRSLSTPGTSQTRPAQVISDDAKCGRKIYNSEKTTRKKEFDACWSPITLDKMSEYPDVSIPSHCCTEQGARHTAVEKALPLPQRAMRFQRFRRSLHRPATIQSVNGSFHSEASCWRSEHNPSCGWFKMFRFLIVFLVE